MLTSWNVSRNLPTTLAESIAGYNALDETMWIVGVLCYVVKSIIIILLFFLLTYINITGGWNGTTIIDTLWKYDLSTHEFEEQSYTDKQSFTAESYTSKDVYIYFTNHYKLYEFSMTSNAKFHEETDLSPGHYADRPSITTDQVYLYLTGGIENSTNEISNKLSIYDTNYNRWLPLNTPSMIYARIGHNCIARNNYLYIFGGYINNQQTLTTNTIEKLYIGNVDNIDQQNWTLLNDTLDNAIAFMRIAEINGLIYIIGGYSEETNSSVNTVNILDPMNDKVISGVSLTVETNRPAVTVDAKNQQIYIFGGHETWESAAALDITQKSIVASNESGNGIDWILYSVFGIVALCLCVSFAVYYKCYKHCHWRGEVGEKRRKITASERDEEVHSYGAAAEGMNMEGRRARFDSANKLVAGSVVDTASYEAL